MKQIISLILLLLKTLNRLIWKASTFLNAYLVNLQPHVDPKQPSTCADEKYRLFSVDSMPIVEERNFLDYQLLLRQYKVEHGKDLKPVKRRQPPKLDYTGTCPLCGAPHHYLYENNISRGQMLCKVCQQTFTLHQPYLEKIRLKCPHCGKALDQIKDRQSYFIYKCRYRQCSFYLNQLASMTEAQQKRFKKYPHEFKVHYIFRAFDLDLPTLDSNSLMEINSPIDLSRIRHSKHVLGLILTYYVNYGLSSRKTAMIMKDIHQIKISHQTIVNYANATAKVVQPFLETYPYELSDDLCGDETYVTVKGKKHYVFFISDKVKKMITSYEVFAKRDTESAIKAIYTTLRKYQNKLPDELRLVVDGNPIYNAAHLFFTMNGLKFNLIQVIGLTNKTETDQEYRPFKQITERLNRTFKADYLQMNGFKSIETANSYMVLFSTFFNFLRPHKGLNNQIPVQLSELESLPHMPAKWIKLIEMSYDTFQ